MPTKKRSRKPAAKYCYVNAYKVVRKAPHNSPDAKVANHGYVLGSLRIRVGNSREKKKAEALLRERYGNVTRGEGKICKSPFAVALWIYVEKHPAEHWVGADDE